MTQEEKQLLLRDLSARLPYGVLFMVYDDEINEPVALLSINPKRDKPLEIDDGYNENSSTYWNLEDVKPYLRPMSSMTEEEKREYASFIGGQKPFDSDFSAYPKEHRFVYEWDVANYVNWLNSRHFDYRGLIPMGLAIETPEGMYK